MPAKKKSTQKKDQAFEETLWDTANTALRASAERESEGTPQSVPEGQDNLRGSVESSDWSGATKTTRQGCPEGEGGGAHQFYTMQNVFYLPETSRWSYIQQHAKQGDIALKIDSALTDVEKSNASLKLSALVGKSAKLDEVIRKNLEGLGYAN